MSGQEKYYCQRAQRLYTNDVWLDYLKKYPNRICNGFHQT